MAGLCKALIFTVVTSTPLLSQGTSSSTGASSSSGMLDSICNTFPLPIVCSKSGMQSEECTKNPGACCAQLKCTSTNPASSITSGTADCSTYNSQMTCAGSNPFSPTPVGVCRCPTAPCTCPAPKPLRLNDASLGPVAAAPRSLVPALFAAVALGATWI
eukprot:TRINITY_DN9459_c0_g1_i1.p2 TRINITY_DN9459_c0_g1~~TRINITY_DN9459_c0_g1_i1.p2  ORF type:complete len:159 (-),score=26.36 TRINITY_DN9459_c0_g1_i1:261-737(-)